MNNLKNNLYFTYLILMAILLCFGFLNVIDLWNPDEPRYVEVAREMFAFDNFLVPHLNGAIYGHKPPMFFWAIAGVMQLFSSDAEWVVRLVPAASGFLMVLFTYFYVSKVFNRNVAAHSAIILLTTVGITNLSRRCNIDTLFSLFILLAFIFIHLGLIDTQKRRLYFLISCLFQGLGVLTKGPLALIFPLFTLLSYAFFTNDKDIFKKTPWFWGLAIAISVILAWILPAAIAGGKEYTYGLLFKHTIQRYASGISHPQNFLYYFYSLPFDTLPWSLFLPFVIVKGIMDRKKPLDKNLLWFILWVSVNFIFMSFSTEKRSLYLLPLYPALSVICGYYLSDETYRRDNYLKFAFYITNILISVTSIALLIFYYLKTKTLNPYFITLSSLTFWVGLFMVKYHKNFKNIRFISTATIVWITFFNVYIFIFPIFNESKSPKIFIEKLAKYNVQWDKTAFFNFYHAGLNFYLKQNTVFHTTDIKELSDFVDKKFTTIIVKKQSVKDVEPYLKNYQYKETIELGHRYLYIYMLK